MKSLYLLALFVAIIVQGALAQYNEEPYINQASIIEYEKEQAVIQSESVPVEAPVEVPVEVPIPDEAPKPKPEELQSLEISESSDGKGSGFSGIAITGVAVALIVGVGYKNYKKEMKFKLPEIPKIPGLNGKESNDCVVEMEVLLSETSEAENYSLAKNRAYKCMVAWTPKRSDEIILRRGDLVCVKECFNDGYTLGRNLSTKFDGIFPTCCLCRAEQNVIGSELVRNGKFTAIPKRVSSKKCQEKRARRASRGVSFISSVPLWNKNSFTALSSNQF